MAVSLVLAAWLGGCSESEPTSTGSGGATAGSGAGGPGATASSSGSGGASALDGWLQVIGNRIHVVGEGVFRGRGANIHDTRSCNACTWYEPDVGEVERRIDLLVDDWGANFMRLTLESYGSAEGRVHWQGLREDPDYLADVVTIVDHMGTKPDAYVMVSLWVDPTFTVEGWPSSETAEVWRTLVGAIGGKRHVMFGLVNEPEYNFDGAQDEQAWQAMNDTVQVIRDAENELQIPHHVVAVQGTGAWARRLDYYVDHPITAGGGDNVAYEVHVYDPASEFQSMFVEPAQTLPVIIGEFGSEDADQLMDLAIANDVPHLAWTFHMRCPPNLLVDNSGGGCGSAMDLEPTAWGQTLRDRLAQPW